MFRITIKEQEKKQKPIDWRTLPARTVIEFEDGVEAVVFDDGEHPRLFLLSYVSGDPWFMLADGYEDVPVKKVLGTIEEIVVKGGL